MFGNLIKGLSRPDRQAESVDQCSRALTGAAIVVINYTSIVQLTEKWKMGLELELGFGLGPAHGFRSGFWARRNQRIFFLQVPAERLCG